MRGDKDVQLDIALVHEVCPVCAKPMNEHIMMDKRLRKSTPLHDKCHGKATGVSPVMCDECRARLNAAGGTGIYMVEFDKDKTNEDDLKTGNVWRTGKIIAVSQQAFDRWFGSHPKQQWSYVPAPIVSDILADAEQAGFKPDESCGCGDEGCQKP